MIRKAILLGAVLAAAFVAATERSGAQQIPRRALPGAEETTPSPLPSPNVEATQESISVPLNQARMVELPPDVASVIVVNETIADVNFNPDQPNHMYIVARAMGGTNIILVDADGVILHQLEVRVDADTELLTNALKELLPDLDIKVTAYNGNIFLRGYVRSAAHAANVVSIAQRFVPDVANVVNMLTIKGAQQVIMKVKVAEVDRSIVKQIQANSAFDIEVMNRGVSFSSAPSIITPSATVNDVATMALQHGLSAWGLGAVSVTPKSRNSLVKILAEPTLLALSGETARLVSGGEYPYPAGVDASGNYTVDWQEYGVVLGFTPFVLDSGRINLQIRTEVSALDSGNAVSLGTNVSVNALTTKRADSVVELPSGGSMMIAGLLQNDLTTDTQGIPLLKDVPILGSLFRSTSYERTETELVIAVTAYLAKPLDNSDTATPTDGLVSPDDIDLYLLGRLHKAYGKNGEKPFMAMPFQIEGPFGYIMETLP